MKIDHNSFAIGIVVACLAHVALSFLLGFLGAAWKDFEALRKRPLPATHTRITSLPARAPCDDDAARAIHEVALAARVRQAELRALNASNSLAQQQLDDATKKVGSEG